MSIVPNFDYLLVMPSGNIIGFHDEETAKAYINNYYYFRTRNNDVVGAYEDLTEDFLTRRPRCGRNISGC